MLGTESLVVDLGGGLDKILEVGSEEEVAQVDEFAVSLILDVDDTPSVLSAANLLAVDNDRLLGSDDSEGDEALDLAVQGALLLVKLVVVVGVHLEVVESELLLNALLEGQALLRGQGVSLGDDGNDVDDIRKLLQDDNVDRLQGVARGVDEEEAAVDTSILDVALSLCRELLAQVRGVLILDILDDGVPATVVVDQVAVSRGVDDVESQSDAVLLDDVGHGLDLSGGADGLLGLEATLGVDEVRSEDGVNQGGLAHTSLANADDVELEATLQELALNLGRDAVETDMALRSDGAGRNGRHLEGGVEGQLVVTVWEAVQVKLKMEMRMSSGIPRKTGGR